MSLSDLQQRLLDHVGTEPDSATVIWRRFYGLPEGNLTINRRMKRERRTTAAMLEDLAYEGYVTRTEIERHGAMVPAFYQRDAYDASFPSRKELERRARAKG